MNSKVSLMLFLLHRINHWQKTQTKLTPPVEIPYTPPATDSNKSIEDQNREFWKEHPNMKEVSGLQFKN